MAENHLQINFLGSFFWGGVGFVGFLFACFGVVVAVFETGVSVSSPSWPGTP